jgi:uncharacterized protein YbaP (TraB family)
MTPRFGRWLILAAALALGPATYAQTALSRATSAPQERSYTQGLLWKIEGPLGQPSYVFGTMHVADARVLALPVAVRQSFDRTASFAMEVKFDPANMLQLASRMVMTDGRDLRAVVGPALYQKIAAVAPSIGLPPDVLRLFKPWAIALLLMMPPSSSEDVLDNRLYEMALEQKKGVHELESIDEQVDLFDRMAENEQIAMLSEAVANRERLPAQIESMVNMYLKRDLAALYRLSEAAAIQDPAMKRLNTALMQRLLDQRNVRMADRADPLLKSGSAFVAVGALHLYGERGVLALLASRGYRVTRVY